MRADFALSRSCRRAWSRRRSLDHAFHIGSSSAALDSLIKAAMPMSSLLGMLALSCRWCCCRNVGHCLIPEIVPEHPSQVQNHAQMPERLLAGVACPTGPARDRDPPDTEMPASGGVRPIKCREDRPNLKGGLGESCRD